ncbi:MAG: MBL fold metallo-hydrolase [Chloroflexota bacterium]|nr:MBL fold metallo-hydrolase [Chloroflexota bacterium]
MAKLIILGSSSAIPNTKHANAHFVVKAEKKCILVDCVGSSIVRLEQVGLDFRDLTDLFLTHFHPDHVSGLPLLLMNMWLLGRQQILHVYGLHSTIDKAEKMMALFQWQNWPDFFPVAFHRLPAEEMTLALDDDEFRIFTSPVQHLIPTMGLRIEILENEKTIAYSCDTEPSPAVENLAAGADVLLHEATGETRGHSSAAQAGDVAHKAQAKSLYLIHYDARNADLDQLLIDAGQTFGGKVALATDFMEIDV